MSRQKDNIKDLNNALEAGEQFGAPLPLTEMVQGILMHLSVVGFGSDDHSAIARYYQELSGASVQC